MWAKYAETARLLLVPGGAGKLICTTISENEDMMRRLVGVRSQQFRPSIPNLVYQCVYLIFSFYRFASFVNLKRTDCGSASDFVVSFTDTKYTQTMRRSASKSRIMRLTLSRPVPNRNLLMCFRTAKTKTLNSWCPRSRAQTNVSAREARLKTPSRRFLMLT